MQAWLWKVDPVHQVWLETLPLAGQERIRATVEARIAAAHPA